MTPDICAYDTLKVAAIRGTVVYEPSKIGTEPSANARVELRKYSSDGRVVAKVTTDMNGRFDFGKVKNGKYVVYVEAPKNISHIYFPIEFTRTSKSIAGELEIHVTLGFGFKGCRGSYAQYGIRNNFSN